MESVQSDNIMPKFMNLVGQKFNRWMVLENVGKNNNDKYLYKCLCCCGTIKIIVGASLTNGSSLSCGCLQREIISKINFHSLVGQKFNKLTVVECVGKDKNKHYLYKCLCECGNIKIIAAYQLASGHTKSCGCSTGELLRNSKLGEKNPHWRGGFNRKEYPPEWNNKLKEQIRNRDNRKCQYPNCNYDDTKENGKLHVHHIDGNKKNCDELNLVSLCSSHHTSIENNNPQKWISYFYQYTESFIIRW